MPRRYSAKEQQAEYMYIVWSRGFSEPSLVLTRPDARVTNRDVKGQAQAQRRPLLPPGGVLLPILA